MFGPVPDLPGRVRIVSAARMFFGVGVTLLLSGLATGWD